MKRCLRVSYKYFFECLMYTQIYNIFRIRKKEKEKKNIQQI